MEDTIFVFQVLNFDGQIFLVEDFAEEIGQSICSVGQILTGLVFHIVGQICIDALESYMLVVTLCMGDESGVDVVFQDDSIHALDCGTC